MKKLRAISFDNAQEINTLVHVLSQYTENNKLYNDNVKKLLSVAREVQNMFINPTKWERIIMTSRSINKEVATLIQQRLDKGAQKYGRDIPLNDNRDFLQETIEEALDAAIYLACYLIQLKRGKMTNIEKAIKCLKKEIKLNKIKRNFVDELLDEIDNLKKKIESLENRDYKEIKWQNKNLKKQQKVLHIRL